jgi:hypothetical protein
MFDVLVAKENHFPLQQGLANVLDRFVAEVLREADAGNLRANMTGDG